MSELTKWTLAIQYLETDVSFMGGIYAGDVVRDNLDYLLGLNPPQDVLEKANTALGYIMMYGFVSAGDTPKLKKCLEEILLMLRECN